MVRPTTIRRVAFLAALLAAAALAAAGCSQRTEPPRKRADQPDAHAGGATAASPAPRGASDGSGALPPGHPPLPQGMRGAEGGALSSASTPSSASAGARWTVPAGWSTQPARTMRVATYSIPAAPGDTEGAECAVFHFGSDQGGQVDDNIARWVGQFESSPALKRSTQDVGGIPVTRVEIVGTYLAPSGPMMQSSGSKPDFRLLGAIVEAPRGLVFFKLVGPAKTVAACEKDFGALVASIVAE
jgi:hypothetical protein